MPPRMDEQEKHTWRLSQSMVHGELGQHTPIDAHTRDTTHCLAACADGVSACHFLNLELEEATTCTHACLPLHMQLNTCAAQRMNVHVCVRACVCA